MRRERYRSRATEEAKARRLTGQRLQDFITGFVRARQMRDLGFKAPFPLPGHGRRNRTGWDL